MIGLSYDFPLPHTLNGIDTTTVTVTSDLRPCFPLSAGRGEGLSNSDPKLPALRTVAPVGPSPVAAGLLGTEVLMIVSGGRLL